MTEMLTEIIEPLRQANEQFAKNYPGETGRRQPVHTVYGGAHLFKSDSAQRLGSVARRSLEQFAPDAGTFAKAIGLGGDAELHATIYQRVTEKLQREPVEDFRIDFEDGYGNRPDVEEDGHAASAAAIDKGFTAESVFIDEPVSYIAGPNQPPYRPLNYDRKFEGRLVRSRDVRHR